MKLIAKLIGVFDDLPDFMLWMLVGVCALMAAFWMGDSNGAHRERAKLAPQITALSTHIKRVNGAYDLALDMRKTADTLVLAELRVQYDALADQRVRTQTLIKEIPKYVTQTADARCVVPAGFVHVHNASLAPEAPAVPSSPPGDADASSGVALSTVAETVAANNAECVERGVIVGLWQRWYTESKVNYERASALIEGAALQPPERK